MGNYEKQLRAELLRYGFTWFPLSPSVVAELERRQVDIPTAYNIATDVANGFPFEESLKANLLD
jgi:hypothetical protein